jgi:hypothetical protein
MLKQASARRVTIKRQLARLVTATVLPAGIAATLLIGYSFEPERTIAEQERSEPRAH